MPSTKYSSVVVDTNIWISALVFGGKPREVFEAVVREGFVLVVSQQILAEVRRVLHTKFPAFVQDFEDLLNVLRPRLTMTELGSVTIDVCRDPMDNMVLETAVVGQARIIISGDKDLLVLKTYRQISIVKAADFLAVMI